jgi:hypothetical protein
MARFFESSAGQAFVASAGARQTSPEIMEAIAFLARDEAEAVATWEGGGITPVVDPNDLWERVTKNGLRDAADFTWGAAGSDWWSAIQSEVGHQAP